MSHSSAPVSVNGVLDSGLYDFEQGFIELVCRLAFQYDTFSSPDDVWNDCVGVVNEMANRLFQSLPPNRPQVPRSEPVSTPGRMGGEEPEPVLRVISRADEEEMNRRIHFPPGAAGPSGTTSGGSPPGDPPSHPDPLPTVNQPLPPRPLSPLGPLSGSSRSPLHDTGDGVGPQADNGANDASIDSRLGGEEGPQADNRADNALTDPRPGGEEGPQADNEANDMPVDSRRGSKRPTTPSSSPSPPPPTPPTRVSGRKRTAVQKWAPEPPSRSPKKRVAKRRRVQSGARGRPADEPQEPPLSPASASPMAVEPSSSRAAISPLLAMFPEVSGICVAPWVPKSLFEQDSDDLGDRKMKSHSEVFIFVGLFILTAAHQ
jgi:hypothetical protein